MQVLIKKNNSNKFDKTINHNSIIKNFIENLSKLKSLNKANIILKLYVL